MKTNGKLASKLVAIATSAALAATTCVPAVALAGSSSDDTLEFSHTLSFNSYYFNTQGSDSTDITVPFNYRWITSSSPEAYSSDLAIWSCELETDTDSTDITTIDGKKAVTDDGSRDNAAFLEAYGFEDVQRVKVTAPVEGQDENDTTCVVMAHRPVTVDGTSYDAYVMAVEATDTNDQWGSNLDVGASTSDYSGSHPEWVNKNNCKGFDVTANRADKTLAKYMGTYAKDASAKVTLCVSGFSRGADIANILGAAYEKGTEVGAYGSSGTAVSATFDVSDSVRSYTFACSNVTESSKKEATRDQVFNIVNTDDLVAAIPDPDWGFRRYGNNYEYSISSSTDLTNRFKELCGKDYSCIDAKALVSKISTTLGVKNRADLYKTNDYTMTFTDKSTAEKNKKEAEETLASIKSLMSDLGLSESDGLTFSEITPTADGKGYQFTKHMKIAAVLEAAPALINAYEKEGTAWLWNNLSGIMNFLGETPAYDLLLSPEVLSLLSDSSNQKLISPHVCCSAMAICERTAAEHQHQWGDWQVITEPSYTSDGVEQRVCAYCGKTDEKKLDKLKTVKGATGVANGIKYTVTNVSKGTVDFSALATSAAKKAKTVTVPTTVKLFSKKFAVTSISAKALKGSKATKLIVKSASVSSAALAKAIKGASVKVVQVKAYANSSKNKALAKKYSVYFAGIKAIAKVKVNW